MTKLILAMDKRTVDRFGKMHVSGSNISKACVNPYYGREIPNSAALGLQADRVYMLLRDPEELRKAAPTFNLLPILDKHIPITAERPARDLWIGTTGDKAEFAEPFLRNSLALWIAGAIKEVNDRTKYELSSAYSYDADMTPGVYEGIAYDGIMRNIKGNHVALVKAGRAGPDVVVGDSKPLEKPKMSKKLSATQRMLVIGLSAYLPTVLAQDAEIGDLSAVVGSVKTLKSDKDKQAVTAAVTKAFEGKIAEDAEIDISGILDVIAQDEEDASEPPAKVKAKPAAKVAEDDEPTDADAPPGVTTTAMDAAISTAVANAEKATVARMQAISIAEKECRPILGDIMAQDSAEAVYKLACDAAKIDAEGVTGAPALRALVMHEIKHRDAKAPAPRIAQDSAADGAKSFAEMFPNAAKVKKGG